MNMRIILISLFCFLTTTSFSQITPAPGRNVILTDVLGVPLDAKSEAKFEGSVFINDQYQTGRITINGKQYSDVLIKLNIERNVVYFQKDGIELVPAGVVNVVEFLDPLTGKYNQVFKNGFPPTGRNTSQTYYQVLDSGSALLLKHVGVVLRESSLYGQETVTKKYEKVKSYYFFVNGKLVPAKKSDDVLAAMNDKRAAVQIFISSNKIKVNKEEDLKLLAAHYNKL
jgi:hypothetical protein